MKARIINSNSNISNKKSTQENLNSNIFLDKLSYLGYAKPTNIDYSLLSNLLKECPIISFEAAIAKFKMLDKVELEELMKFSKDFYSKYFDVHDIGFLSISYLSSNFENISQSESYEEAYEKYSKLVSKISPFDLSINLISGNSMTGEIKKPLISIPNSINLTNKIVPFSHIELGKNLTDISKCTCAHEIAHTQLESNIGYTENYFTKEVLSIFIEKLAALELDPSGELLKKQENARFGYIYQNAETLNMATTYRKLSGCDAITDEIKFELYMSVYSGLMAENLFDKYIKATNKDKMLYGIQDVFDGKITQDEYLKNENININDPRNFEVIKKYCKKR